MDSQITDEQPFQERVYKNNHGLLEIYGMSSDPGDHGYARTNPSRIGLYVQSNRDDSAPMRSAAVPLSPQLAREVAKQLADWADRIDASS